MNRTYRVVWNAALGVFQVASELVKGRGKTKSSKAIKLSLVLAAGALVGPVMAADLPTGGNIAGGAGAISQSGGNMTIDQSTGKMAIDWQGFSIGAGKTVQFNQPGASSIALNRVLGADVSVIQGALRANGQVFLVNPNGVLFSPTAQVDVGGLVASTLKLSTEDFMAGRYRFSGDSAASVINQGRITAGEGGTVALIAARIVNDGTITANRGSVLMGAGSVVTLDLGGPATLEVEQGALDALIENGGAIRADAGTILLTARAAENLAATVINSTGIIEARSLDLGEDGVVTLVGEQGGVKVAGLIDVSSATAKGGKVVVTGDRVEIGSTARVEATGATGGGEIYVGGGWQGEDPAIKQAHETHIAAGALLDASAKFEGDGGTIVAWSDVERTGSLTRVDGHLKATGGASGGNGGRIETSGGRLAIGTAADASAQNGKGGLWLLDPTDVTVANTIDPLDPAAANVGLDAINTSLANGTDVMIIASNDITWQDSYTASGVGDGTTLTLSAGRNINLNGNIDASGADNGALNLEFNGDVKLGADVTLSSNGGNILFASYLDSDSDQEAAAHGLAINTNGNGTVTFSDQVGGTNLLKSLTVTTADTGKTYINGSIVRTWGDQIYNSPVELKTGQFENAGFEDGTNGWTVTDGRIYLNGGSTVDGHATPDDSTPYGYPESDEVGDAAGANMDYSHQATTDESAEGNGSLVMTSDGNCDVGQCVVRGGYVVSDSTIALPKDGKVHFQWMAKGGSDSYDVFGYLLNVETGETQVILNETGATADAATGWTTASVTVDKAGTYKFVFVSGSWDATGGKALGAQLYIDDIGAAGPKGLQGSSITFGKGLNALDNDLALKANEINFGGPVSGSGRLDLQTLDPTTSIEMGGVEGTIDAYGNGILNLSDTDLANLQDGFTSINIGDSGMAHGTSITVVDDSTPVSVHDDLVLNAGRGDIHIDGGLISTDTDMAPGGMGNPAAVIVLESNGGIVDQGANGSITANGLVLLGEGATHVLNGPANDVDVIASNTGSVSYSDVDDLAVGAIILPGSDSLADPDGIAVAGMTNTGDLILTANKIDIDEAMSAGGNTALTADEIDIGNTVSGDGELALKQRTSGLDIHLGGADEEVVADGDPLRLSEADLALIQDGFDTIAIGDSNTGNVTVDADGATFKDDVAITAGGKLNLEGDLTLSDDDGDADGGAPNVLELAVTAQGGAGGVGSISADSLALRGEGDFNLGSGDHEIDIIAADVGSLTFKDKSALVVGEVDGLKGITSDERVSLTTGGDLIIDQGISIENGPGDSGEGETRDDDIITLNVAGTASQTDNPESALDARGLVLLEGDFELNSAGNMVGDIASDAGKVAYVNSGDLKVGELTATYADGTQQTVTGVNNDGDVSIGTTGDLAINEALTTTGNAFLNVDGTTTQDAEGVVTANGLALTGGDFELRNAGNTVGDIASDAGKVAFVNTGNLKVGTLTETDGAGNERVITGVNNTGDVSIGTTGDLAINEALATTGNVFLDIDGATTQDAAGNITANGLALSGGDFELRNGGNTVGDIASDAGKVAFVNTGNLKVGALTETDGNGDTVKTVTGVNNTGDVSISTAGDLAINQALATTGNVFLDVDGTTIQAVAGNITANGLALSGGDFELRNAGNTVGDIASDAGKVAFVNTGNLKVGALIETDAAGRERMVTGVNNTGDVSISTTGDLAINQALATTGNAYLNVAGKATQDAEGNITANGLALTGGDFDLRNGGNMVGDIASRAGEFAFVNAAGLKVGTITETDGNGNIIDTITGIDNSGKVHIATTMGDITLAQNVATSNAEADAVVLAAGQSKSAGDGTGGSVQAASGVRIATGPGGRAVIYTGSLAGSNGLTDVVGAGSGNFRYNSDQTVSNFSKALGSSGVYAVYREQPTLIVSTNGANPNSKVYDGKASFDGGGIAGYDAYGLYNGDSKLMLGMPEYWVASSMPGKYLINISGLSDLGYLIQSSPDNADLTITPAVDYDAARQNVALETQHSVENFATHFPAPTLAGLNEAATQGMGTLNGGLLLVDRAEIPVAQGEQPDQIARMIGAQDSGEDGGEEKAGGIHCADGGESSGQCAAYPPQTIFVVRGGVRMPVAAFIQ